MQLFNINANTFQTTLTEEYEEFKKELQKNGNLHEDITSYLDGNILFSINQNSTALKTLLTTGWSVRKENKQQVRIFQNVDSTPYLNDVTTTIIKSSETFSLKDALIQVGEIAEMLGDKLAGCLLVSGKTILNPLHPITALVLMDEQYKIQDSFKIVTYLYNNKQDMHYTYNSNEADMSKIRKNIMLIISLYSNKQKINKTVEVIKVEQRYDEVVLSDINQFFKESVSQNNEYEGDFIIVPHQLLTKGIVAPYYGTSVIIREENTSRGALLCPMHSVNVSSTYRDTTRKEPKFDGICTGSTPKTTMDGLRTLNHANLSSPLHSHSMEAGAILYADECIRQAINLYKLGGFLPKEETPEETGQRWVEEDELDGSDAEMAELEREVDAESLQWEREDAEHEARNSDDAVDAMTYGIGRDWS